MKKLVIGLMGSGQDSWTEFSVPLAVWIAQEGHHLLTGGGGGVMLAAAEAFCKTENRNGVSIGVVPTLTDSIYGYVVKPGYPNAWVELPIVSPLSTYTGEDPQQISRNHINILTSQVIVALPGSKGTRNEVDLAMQFGKPVILFGPDPAFKDFPTSIMRTSDLKQVKNFIRSYAADKTY